MNINDTVLKAGDVITLAGPASAFADAAASFRAPGIVAAGAHGSGHGTGRAAGHDSEIVFAPSEDSGCSHLDAIHPVRPSANGCEDCLRIGSRWVHLRICLTCGHVGCCDSSPNRHATAHFHSTGHPIVRSMERGETWGWCYVDEVML